MIEHHASRQSGRLARHHEHKDDAVTTTYRIVKISDTRSRGTCYWFEILAQLGDERWSVGTYDTKDEAREALAKIRAATAATV